MSKSVVDVERPPDLSECEIIEWDICMKTLAALEKKWLGLLGSNNADQLETDRAFEREFQIRIDQTRVITELDIQAVENEMQMSQERIKQELEDDKKLLFKRLVRGYYTSYLHIMEQLKGLMGPDFDAFQAENEIEFPTIPQDKGQERKVPPPEDPKVSLSPHEADRLLKEVKRDYGRVSEADQSAEVDQKDGENE